MYDVGLYDPLEDDDDVRNTFLSLFSLIMDNLKTTSFSVLQNFAILMIYLFCLRIYYFHPIF